MISLEASTRTCKVDTASAARSESDRFLNPNNVVCIPWNGRDLAGRVVSADSFYTKTSGCNSAADRVIVENALRPQYFEYINLNDYGVRADMYGDNMNFTDAGVANRQLNNTQKYAGSFNLQPSGPYQPTCSFGAYELGQKQRVSQQQRNRGAVHEHFTVPEQRQRNNEFAQRNANVTNGYRSCRFKQASGF